MKQPKEMKRILLHTTLTTSLALMFDYSHCQANLSLEKKAGKIIAELKKNYEYPTGAKDTLIDLNGDNYKDILIEYYGLAGTGLKNRVEVYLYNHTPKKFRRCQQLCDLGNPTFYFDKKIVVGYYIGMGGGDAAKLKWNGLRLDSLERIEVDVLNKGNDMSFKVTSFDFRTKKTTSKVFDIMTLPKEYKYFQYEPIIKRNDP